MDKKSLYTEFLKKHKNIPLFYQGWWWETLTDGNWDVAISPDKNNVIKAAMPYTLMNKKGLKIATQPMLTPYAGILFFYPSDLTKQNSIYSFQNKHTNTIIKQLPANLLYQAYRFAPDYDNWYPFYKHGYEQTTKYTYILQGISDHSMVFNGFSNTFRRQIREAEKKFEIVREDNVCTVFSLIKKSLKRQKIKFSYKKAIIENIDKQLKERNQREIFVARDKNGRLASGLYLVWDNNTAYLLGLGADYDTDIENSTKLLIWESIKYASGFVDNYDFEGSMLEGVERLYKNFGGKKTPYYEIKKYKNRFVKAVFSLLKG